MLGALLLIITVGLNVILGLAVGLRRRENVSDRWFVILTAAIVVWAISNYLVDHGSTLEIQYIALHFAYLGGVLVTMAVFFFAKTFGKEPSLPAFTKKDIFPGAIFIVLMILSLTPFVVKGIVPREMGGNNDIPGVLYFPFIVSLVSMFSVAVFILMHRAARQKSPLQRIHMRVIALSFISSYPLAVLTNVILPSASQNWSTTQIGTLFTLPMVGIIAFSIIRHKLFDIRLAIARAVTYILLLGTLIFAYAIAVFGFIQLFFQDSQEIGLGQNIVYIVSAVFLAFTYAPLKHFFDRVTDRIFFRHEYDTQETLDKLGDVAVEEIDLRQVSVKSMEILSQALKPEFVSIYIVSPARELKPYKFYIGKKLKHKSKESEQELFNGIGKMKDVIVVTEQMNESELYLQEILNSALIAVAVQLETSRELVGYLFFGQKQNGSMYTAKDVKMLNTVANELALAIENSLRFQEINEFNETLQARISEATLKLQENNQKLHELDAAKDEFISMASHQLRTPLTAVKGYLSMVLEEDAGKVPSEQRKLLAEAFASSQRMVYLIGDFLNVSRLKTGKFVLELSQVDLSKLVAAEVSQLESTAKERRLKLKYDRPEPILLQIDQNKIQQVIMNFIDNAIFYSRPSSEIKIDLVQKTDEAVFKVSDSGIGVPKDEQHRLFTKFYRASNAKKARPDGTGIGLFMAKKVIIAHGGFVIFESKERKGSTFGFSLPLTKK